jgi:hypothetical protein
MKTFKILLYSSLLICCGAFAQNYNRNGYGVNQDLGRGYSKPSTPDAAEISESKAKQLDKFMAQLKKELSLDELQTIAIRNEVSNNNKNIEILLKKETSEEEKSKEIKAMMDRTEVIVNSYLNKEQKVKYKELEDRMKAGKKSKKGKNELKNDAKQESTEDKKTEE